MMAYKDLGRIVTLDYHAEYFLELVTVHFVSEITGLNYMLVYTFIIRIGSIMVWSVLFLWACNSLSKAHSQRHLWLLLLALSMLIAVQGYNSEAGFAPLLLLTWYLIVLAKPRSYELVMCNLIISIGIIFASFRETLIVASICLLAVLISWVARRVNPSSSLAKTSSIIFPLLLLFLGRVFQFSSHYYLKSYTNRFFALVNSIQTALRGEWTSGGGLLVTVRSIGNPIDQVISLVSVASAISFMGFLVILSLRYILRERNRDAFFFSIPISYVLALSIPIASYSVLIIAGVGGIGDYVSATSLARSLAPLVTLTAITYFIRNKRNNQLTTSITRLLKFLAVISLSISIVFAPFLFRRAVVKSTYDMVQIAEDNNELVMMSTGVYYFMVSHVTQNETIVIGRAHTPATSFFLLVYLLPLKYQLGEDRVTTAKTPLDVPLADIYDNAMYSVTFYRSYAHGSLVINQSAPA